MTLSTEQLLERSRRELLDLSTRNRLLAIPVGNRSARVIEFDDERSEQVFRILVTERKPMSFLPGTEGRKAVERGDGAVGADRSDRSDRSESEEAGLPQPEEEGPAEGAPAKRHTDARLQTQLSPERLQSRLLGLYRDAQTMIEEQGVNILYLALGHLRWFEADRPEVPRHAPLVLVPVAIRRRSASDRFHLRWLEEDPEENLSLRARLKGDFGIDLPPFPEEESVDWMRYFEAVTEAVKGMPGWEVHGHAMTLGFFSFAKFLMYRDLDPAAWPAGKGPAGHPLVRALLRDGFPSGEPPFPEDVHLDELIPSDRLDHVVDADHSQSLAIETVRRGRSLVIQGPPGTGKSQCIANIIATAVLDGKRVLFVAEKLAALEVVKRRLEREGLGDLCLELHSNKSNKRVVIEELGRTWKLGAPKARDEKGPIEKLERQRTLLNAHARALHERRVPAGMSAFEAIGTLVLLGDRGRDAGDAAFPGSETWTPEERRERRQLIGELAERIEDIGLPSEHPWRGVGCDGFLEIDRDPVERGLKSARQRVEALRTAMDALAAALEQPAATDLAGAERHVRMGRLVAGAPEVDKAALCEGLWDAGLDGLNELLAAGTAWRNARRELEGRVVEEAWSQDFSDVRGPLAAHGRSWLRFLNGDFRRALARLRGVSIGAPPKGFEERVAMVDALVAGQRALRAIGDAGALGQAAFGVHWRRERSDWDQLAGVLEWVRAQRAAGMGREFRQVFAGVREPERLSGLSEDLEARLAEARAEVAAVFERLRVETRTAFGTASIEETPVAELEARLGLWGSRLDVLPAWTSYFGRARLAREWGCGPLVELLETGTVPTAEAVEGFDRIDLGARLREWMAADPALGRFDGTVHARQIARFRELDRDRLDLARYRVLKAHFEGMPGSGGAVGPVGILRGEMERKRGHRTVRRLLRDAGSVAQAIKPVFMMSPLSVAQFLDPGAVEFDLLVVDEASQVQPVDALGAMARCRQMVVVGDSRQLPPTRFFSRLTSEETGSDDDETGDGTVEAKDVESILGLCCARGLPQSLLRWHYRSRHHSLIAVSNREFYDNRLYIVPSPRARSAGLGLGFRPVADGVFDTGGTGSNRIEAREVVRAVIEHALRSPELSLGVAAFSVRQQQAIVDELERVRRENPDLEAFFVRDSAEPFFVKNLENVQGDERDVMFISVGYGRGADGRLAMRFGPLGAEGGERRLNVLISRARRRCEVFASILPEDIDLERASGRGVAALRTFLEYARSGRIEAASRDQGDEGAAFERAVRQAVESLGHAVDPRVGVAGCFIDLAVRHPDRPDDYLLGIECDGVSYRDARSARDRDRLRQAVLESHGWHLHRIWAADWSQGGVEALRRVRDAIRRAVHDEGATDQEGEKDPPAGGASAVPANGAVEREAAGEARVADEVTVPYREANFAVSKRRPNEIPVGDLTRVVLRIIREEGPIHEEEVVARVRDLWGLPKAGVTVQEAVSAALRSAEASKVLEWEGPFAAVAGAPVRIRNREAVVVPGVRRAERVPPAEVRAAILALVEAHHGAARDEVPVGVARWLGFKVTPAPLRAVIVEQVTALVERGELGESEGMLKRLEPMSPERGEGEPPVLPSEAGEGPAEVRDEDLPR
ncbi:MAG: DUF3320 domain-containing protein [Verrucomicrobiae bacterium]|nr:DUF3320 domain-containing protein [Verrucomicrobiae bacterium]